MLKHSRKANVVKLGLEAIAASLIAMPDPFALSLCHNKKKVVNNGNEKSMQLIGTCRMFAQMQRSFLLEQSEVPWCYVKLPSSSSMIV